MQTATKHSSETDGIIGHPHKLTDDEIEDALLLFAAEPLQRTLKQDIGPERLSIARLQREAAARGCDADDASVTTYITYGYRLEWLPAVGQNKLYN